MLKKIIFKNLQQFQNWWEKQVEYASENWLDEDGWGYGTEDFCNHNFREVIAETDDFIPVQSTWNSGDIRLVYSDGVKEYSPQFDSDDLSRILTAKQKPFQNLGTLLSK